MTEARRTHRLPSTWVQMAIIPTNSDSDASAAASWITVLNMAFSPERRENIVHVLFSSQVIKILVDRGANINARDYRGRTAYRIAEGSKQSFQFQAYAETAEYLKSIGADTRMGVPGTVQERMRDIPAAGTQP